MKMFLADEMVYFVMPEDPRHIFPLVFFNRQKKRIVSEVNPLPADEQFPFFNHFWLRTIWLIYLSFWDISQKFL